MCISRITHTLPLHLPPNRTSSTRCDVHTNYEAHNYVTVSFFSLLLMHSPHCFAPRRPHVTGHLGYYDVLAPFHTRLMPENLGAYLPLFPSMTEEDLPICNVCDHHSAPIIY